jgi:hypothetical protein
MDVLIVEPEKVPRMANIIGDLNSLQRVYRSRLSL